MYSTTYKKYLSQTVLPYINKEFQVRSQGQYQSMGLGLSMKTPW